MKGLLVILFLIISANSFAAGFIAKNKVGLCEAHNIYSTDYACVVGEGSACVERPDKYNCAYHVMSGEVVIIDAAKKALYDLEKDSEAQAAAQERLERIARLQNLRETLASLDGPLDAATIRAFIKHLVKEEIRRLKHELE